MNKYILALSLLLCGLISSKGYSTHIYYTENEGNYIGVFGSVNHLDLSVPHYHLKYKSGYQAGAVLGYKFPEHYRIEGEVSYRRNSLDHAKYEGVKFDAKSRDYSWSYMLNLLYDFPIHSLITPYIGVGAGYNHSKVSVSRGHYHPVHVKNKGNGLAWQGIVGASVPLFCNTELGLEYRYFKAKAKVRDHSLGIALKQFF